MNLLKKTFFGLIVALVTVALLLYISGYGYILKAVETVYLSGHTTAYIDDYTEFSNRRIEAAVPQPWSLHKKYNEVEATAALQKLNDKLNTVAFLVIKNDSIWYEQYAEEYGPNSKTNSFSMAKSIVSALLGKAIFEGKIESLEQPVAHFFPQFDPDLSVGDLASMSSGLNWEENYRNPFSMTARAYFGNDLKEQILELEVVEEPGREFKYLSGNTALLAMVIQEATGQTLSDYLSEKFWKPMGMRNNGFWQVDRTKNGMEKAYCCIASNARNFARFGKLYLNYGRWDGKQLIDSTFVAKSIRPRFYDAPYYGYGFWLSEFNGKSFFYMRGILGQYVIVIPEDNLIITRLGKERLPKQEDQEHPKDLYLYIDEVYNMLRQA